MNVVVTGAAGFLGRRLTDALLDAQSPLPVARLLLVDLAAPPPRAERDARVAALALDLAAPGAAERVVRADCHVLFHLAAAVSGQAEAELELGLRANFDATRALADAARRRAPALRFVFASSVAVYGGEQTAPPDERVAPAPRSSYGCAKAMAELLLSDYSRRGHLDARVVRLPTVSVRGGEANSAVTSFASALVREPLRGAACAVPVDGALRLWLCSPAAATRNLLRAATLAPGALGATRALNLPGVSVAVRDMVAALRAAAGAAAAARVRWERDERVERIVASLPPALDHTRALRLGFDVDEDFADIIHKYITECEDLGINLDIHIKELECRS
ncbi:D-erythronate dehydrogenase-like [Maniola jurtina]|uniref:D-erythronate dehydrogenase-like n=1 Tax=Maniola jurtina TaxID=191418 RepID=UPI001E68C9E3|nr:D-erythronate dehydrogenase-like [Maniola jurtina]XP_045765110.1 D-erythronate dehydrogenase-like [Maniola jurtina]XP_045765111.1 D-erythronate dehydrogenase-like [Maniola jurtina]